MYGVCSCLEHLPLSRDMFENEMRVKEEEYLSELARKDELLLTTVCDLEEKIAELEERNSVSNSVNNSVVETPRVSASRE